MPVRWTESAWVGMVLQAHRGKPGAGPAGVWVGTAHIQRHRARQAPAPFVVDGMGLVAPAVRAFSRHGEVCACVWQTIRELFSCKIGSLAPLMGQLIHYRSRLHHTVT